MKTADLFIIDGKCIEHDSLFEVRQGVTEQEWSKIVTQTIDFYCYMHAAEIVGPAKMDNKDRRVFRRLGRTIGLFKKIDPAAMAGLDIQSLCEQRAKQMKEGWNEVQKTVRIAKAGSRRHGMDIYINDL